MGLRKKKSNKVSLQMQASLLCSTSLPKMKYNNLRTIIYLNNILKFMVSEWDFFWL